MSGRSGCKDLARALQEISQLPENERVVALQAMNNLQCVECTQTAEFDNIVAGGSVNIGDVNQIMSCGIGNSGGTELVEQLKTYISESETKLNTSVNKKINSNNYQQDEKINQNQIKLYGEFKKITQQYNLSISFLFILVIFLFLMRILNI
jgi:hypothetical protein